MKSNYVKRQINPCELQPHDLIKENRLNNEANFIFAGLIDKINIYETFIITKDKKVLTNWNELLAAQKNKVKLIDVIEVDLTDNQIKFLFYTKQTYSVKNLRVVYNMIYFYRDYFFNTEEGGKLYKELKKEYKLKKPRNAKYLSESNKGYTNINIMVGYLLNTSESTIKRIKKIGDHDINLLDKVSIEGKGLIDAYRKVAKFNTYTYVTPVIIELPNGNKILKESGDIEIDKNNVIISISGIPLDEYNRSYKDGKIKYKNTEIV